MLNPEQQAAVEHVNGPMLVLAGAGSGKTRVITNKISHLVEHAGIDAHRVFAVTFTNKAAREMLERVRQTVDKKTASALNISTFHRLGLDILLAEAKDLGYREGLSIFDAEDSGNLLRELGVREPDRLKLAKKVISDTKQAMLTPDEALAAAEGDGETAIARLYQAYEAHLKAYNAVDFDDLIVIPTRHLEQNERARDRWQSRIHYLLVDEYQDTNPTQYRMMRALVGVRARFTVVGDDDQSIYRFRGARPENLGDLSTDFPELKVVKLEQNYRSVQRILRAANAVIGSNERLYEKNLWSALGEGDPIRVVVAPDEATEAERVVSNLGAIKIRTGAKFADFAVLYRSNHQARILEQALRLQGFPYKITGGRSFFDRAEVKDLVGYLRLLVNPDDDRAFLRVINTPKRELGPATLHKLGEFAQERGLALFAAAQMAEDAQLLRARQGTELARFCNWMDRTARDAESMPVDELLDQIIDDLDYLDWLQLQTTDRAAGERKLKVVKELREWIGRLAKDGKSAADVVAHFTLMDLMERQDNDAADEIQLATLHASKGLEFPHVYIVGMHEESLPHANSSRPEDIEEERRLFYVGITRAQETLTLSRPKTVKRGGEAQTTRPSRFIAELPEGDVVMPDQGGTRETRQATSRDRIRDLKSLLGPS